MLLEVFQTLMALYEFTELFKPVLICFVRWNTSRTLHCLDLCIILFALG